LRRKIKIDKNVINSFSREYGCFFGRALFYMKNSGQLFEENWLNQDFLPVFWERPFFEKVFSEWFDC